MNSKLYGKQYKIPTHVMNHLQKYSNNESVGNLLSTGNVSYSQLKQLKHRMENGEKKELGEDSFLSWVNQTLNSDRSSVETSDQIRRDTGTPTPNDQSIKTQRIDTSNHKSTNADVKITEALKRINQLMSKII